MAIGDDDLETIFESGDFNVTAAFTVEGPATVTVQGIFTDATEETDLMTGKIETVDATVVCITSQITAVKRGNSVTINAVTYTVERIARTGVGTSLVYLKT